MIHRFLTTKLSSWLYIIIASFAFVLFLQHTPTYAYKTDSDNQLVTKQIRSTSCADIVGSQKTVLAAVTKIPAGSTLKKAGVSSSSLGTNSDGQPIGAGTTIFAYYAGGEGPTNGYPCDVGKKVVSWATGLQAQESSDAEDRRTNQEEASTAKLLVLLKDERTKYVNKECAAATSPTAATNCLSDKTKRFNTAVASCSSSAYSAAVAGRTAAGNSNYDFGTAYENALLYCLNDQNGLGVDPKAVKGIWTSVEAARNDAGERWDAENADDTTKTKCAVDGIGWIVCPVLTFLGVMNDTAFGFLNNFLEVPARIFTDDATKSAWEAFRNLANVAFVIAFLVIIYSQITGAGISNYGLKKLLPKLIIAAVLVNISFYVCAILVDISNIVGASLYDLLKNIEPGTGDPGGGGGSSLWSGIVATAIGITAGIALLALIIFAPMSLLAFAVVILILIARQAFVILLIVLSPFAFVAYLLPNTEQWFKKWWNSLSAMLLVFPIVALVFGAGSLASRILMDVAQDGGGGGDDEQMLKIVAAGALAIPLFAVPIILKGAMSAAGNVGGRLASLQDKANRGAGKAIKEGRVGEAKMAFDARRQSRRLNRRVGDGKFLGLPAARINKAIDRSSFGQRIGGDRGAAAATAGVFKEFDEEVKRQKMTMSSMSNEKLLDMLAKGEGSEERQAAAGGLIMSRGHRESHLKALEIARSRNQEAEASGDTKAMDTASSIQKQMSEDMKDKPWALGDQALGQLGVGTFGRKSSSTNEAQTHFTDSMQKQLLDRVGTKLSAQSLATMNPDEMKRIAAAVQNGDIQAGSKEMGSLVNAINEARNNKQMDSLIKPEARALHDQILAKAPQGVSPTTTGDGIILPGDPNFRR